MKRLILILVFFACFPVIAATVLAIMTIPLAINPPVILFFFGILIGAWMGIGLTHAQLKFIRNPNKSITWKLWMSAYCILQGPIGLSSIQH